MSSEPAVDRPSPVAATPYSACPGTTTARSAAAVGKPGACFARFGWTVS